MAKVIGNALPVGGVFNETPPTGENEHILPLQVDEDGNLKVAVVTDTPGSETGIGDGRKVVTTAGTAVTLATSTTCKSVIITAETDNTGLIVVGGSTVVAALATRRGTPLNAGDSITIEIDDLADIYLDSTVNGDGVTYTYFT